MPVQCRVAQPPPPTEPSQSCSSLHKESWKAEQGSQVLYRPLQHEIMVGLQMSAGLQATAGLKLLYPIKCRLGQQVEKQLSLHSIVVKGNDLE